MPRKSDPPAAPKTRSSTGTTSSRTRATTVAQTTASTKAAPKAKPKPKPMRKSNVHADTRRSTVSSPPPPASSSPAASSPVRLSDRDEQALRMLQEKKKKAQVAAEKERQERIREHAARMRAADHEDNANGSDNRNHDSANGGDITIDNDDGAEDEGSVSFGFRTPPRKKDSPGAVDDDDEDKDLFRQTFGTPGKAIDEEHQGLGSGVDSDDDAGTHEHGSQAATSDNDDNLMDVDHPHNGIVTPSPSPRKRRRSIKDVQGGAQSKQWAAATSSPHGPKVYKITSRMFTPRTLHLGKLAKIEARRVTITQNPFPSDKFESSLKILQDTARKNQLNDPFTRLLQDAECQKKLTTFVGYARGGLMNSLTKAAQQWVESFFNLPGRKSVGKIKVDVAWLLKDGHFKFGGLDVESQTYDKNLPFGIEGIAHLLRVEFFATRGGANIGAFKEMVAARCIHSPTIEHALMNWSEGTAKAAEFNDDARSRYYYHLSSYAKLAKVAPSWDEGFGPELFDLVLKQSNKTFLLDVEADDMQEVDAVALEAAAIAAKLARTGGLTSVNNSSSTSTSTTVTTPMGNLAASTAVLLPSSVVTPTLVITPTPTIPTPGSASTVAANIITPTSIVTPTSSPGSASTVTTNSAA
ncbi:hypothetical protein BT96DRAFT_1006198 [Gymnopus androsaceus JB14]|uniref:DUF6532 domain-containing protein n=2 Tax=Gymnopus androsaceus JB14 TaxID=1447944 RepID=A0A6A4GL94_9AGAR|nr:hypothetical protein BT96DRAFT_1006198 [Gymnopus androsaceus JB14]